MNSEYTILYLVVFIAKKRIFIKTKKTDELKVTMVYFGKKLVCLS